MNCAVFVVLFVFSIRISLHVHPQPFLAKTFTFRDRLMGLFQMKAGGEKAQDFPAIARSLDCVAKVLVLGIGDPSSHTLP